MSKMKFVLDRAGVRELLKSPEAMAVCKEHADASCRSLGAGYTVTTYTGKTRVNASIAASTQRARRENAENNTILKSLR
jgi:hypothetical protein